MDSAKFQGHWMTFGIFYFIFRIRHLGSFSPCYAWRFGLIFYRQAKNSVQMDSANFQGHWMTFGIFYFIFRIRHLGSLPPCCAWNFGLIFCRQAKNNVQINFPNSALGEFFFVRGTCPGGCSGDLVFSFSGLLGAIRDLESLSAGALARWGGPGTRGIFPPSLGMRTGRSSLGFNFAGEDGRGEWEGRIEAT